MFNLSPYKSYDILFNSLKQLPRLETPGLSNIVGAYMAGKYGASLNNALSTNLNAVIKNVRTDLRELNSGAKSLTDRSERTALNTSDGSVTGTGRRETPTDSTIKVNQVATRQINQSVLLNSKQSTSLTQGTKELTLSSGNRSFTVSVAIQAGEKNSSVLSRTAQGINDLKAGVKARVATDTLGNQQVVVESEKTGKNNGFTIGGDLGTALGLNQITQTGSDAQFTYNDKDYTSDTNSVVLDGGKTKLELKNATIETLSLNQTPDTSGLEKEITSLLSAYNSLQDTLKASPDNKALQAVSRQLDQLTARSMADLKQFGISKDASGQLQVDTNALKSALTDQPDEARELFLKQGSLTQQLQKKTEELLRLPASTLIDFSKTSGSSFYQSPQVLFPGLPTGAAQNSGNLFDMFL